MTLVGFNLTKINAERKPVSEHNVRIENNVGVTDVKEAKNIDAKKTLVRYSFDFTCKYEPGLGQIQIQGELLEMYDKEFGAQIIDHWNKEKKVHRDVLSNVLNHVLGRSNIQAIIISRELGLPSPVQMPKVEVKPKAGTNGSVAPHTDASKPADVKADPKKKK